LPACSPGNICRGGKKGAADPSALCVPEAFLSKKCLENSIIAYSLLGIALAKLAAGQNVQAEKVGFIASRTEEQLCFL
jgi:hypothetical protein